MTAADYPDILKPGRCALCETPTLTFTDPEGEELCLPCLEACLEDLPELPKEDIPEDPAIVEMAREIIAQRRQSARN